MISPFHIPSHSLSTIIRTFITVKSGLPTASLNHKYTKSSLQCCRKGDSNLEGCCVIDHTVAGGLPGRRSCMPSVSPESDTTTSYLANSIITAWVSNSIYIRRKVILDAVIMRHYIESNALPSLFGLHELSKRCRTKKLVIICLYIETYKYLFIFFSVKGGRPAGREPRRLTTLWACAACYRESVTFYVASFLLHSNSLFTNNPAIGRYRT
jgi:hypothetical protein